MSVLSCARVRMYVSVVAVVAVVGVFLGGDGCAAEGAERSVPVVGSFGVGGGLSGGVSERSGEFVVQVPVVSLSGVGGSGVDVGISYRHDLAGSGSDPDGLGAGWVWNISRVQVDGGVRVFPASGGVFEAEENRGIDGRERGSGLRGYVLGDVVFSQTGGVLPLRDGGLAFAYSLAHVSGVDYFGADGLLLARVDVFGNRSEWVWDDRGRLVAVVDSGGSRAEVAWAEGVHNDVRVSVRVRRGDGIVSETTFGVSGGRLVSVTDPVGVEVGLGYDGSGLLNRIAAASGAVTDVTYQILADSSRAVEAVSVHDGGGQVLSQRLWRVVGDGRLPSGRPQYAGAYELWASGDDEYRYATELSDGLTRVVSQYNSLGLVVSRDVYVSTDAGDALAQQQVFVYEGGEDGGVPDPQALPKTYAKPVKTEIIFRDAGGVRTVTEETAFDDAGRVTWRKSADGTVTDTVYDDRVPDGLVLSPGVMVKETVTGVDGLRRVTVNELSSDGKTVTATETFTGGAVTAGGDLVRGSRAEQVVDSDGCVSEQRVVAVGELRGSSDAVVTRYARSVGPGTVTITRTDAAGTPAESSTSTVTEKTTGAVLAEYDQTGRKSATAYDAAGRVVTQTDLAGRVTTTRYENAIRSGENTTAEHDYWGAAFAGAVEVTRVTGPDGVTRSEYTNVLGEIVVVTDNISGGSGSGSGSGGGEAGAGDDGGAGAGGVGVSDVERVIERREYEQNSSRVTVTDAYGLVTTTVADVLGRPVEVITPTGVRQLSVYDDVRSTSSVGLVAGSGGLSQALSVATLIRDDADRVVEETAVRSDGLRVPTVSTRFDGLARTASHTAADLTTDFEFNTRGTPKTMTVTPGNTQTFAGQTVTAEKERDAFGAPIKKILTQEDGETREGVARVFDAAGRVVSQTDQNGDTVSYTHTLDGLVTEARNQASGTVIRNTYDPATRALTLTETMGEDRSTASTGYEYDPVTGAVVNVFDPVDRARTSMHYTWDVFGNMTGTIFPDGKTITHRHDDHGRRTSDTDVSGNTTQYAYDEYGRISGATQTTADNTALATVAYTYDDYDRVKKLSYGNGTTTQYTFTSVDQVTTETTTHGTELITKEAYEYDSHGNLAQRTTTNQAANNSKPSSSEAELTTETLAYTYDAHNRLTHSRIYAGPSTDGQPHTTTDYTINVSGDVTKEITTTRASGSGTPNVTTTVDVNASRTHVTERNFEYNERGHLTAVTTDGVRAEQRYDKAGNLTHTAENTTTQYNVHNQPVSETWPDGTTTKTAYWANGQRRTTSTYHPAKPAGPSTATNPTTIDQIITDQTSTDQTDPRGTNLSDASSSVVVASAGTDSSTHVVTAYWDGAALVNDTHITTSGSLIGTAVADQPYGYSLAASSDTTTASYLIGATRHSRSLIRTSSERAARDTPAAGYVGSEDNPRAKQSSTVSPSSSGTEYYVTDRHGSITATVNGDGAVTASYAYTDYGKTTITTPNTGDGNVTGPHYNPFQYAGEYTTEQGVQKLGARTYNPNHMRFTTQDTAELHNLYNYTNNPITNSDPTGETSEKDGHWVLSYVGSFLALLGFGLSTLTITAPLLLTAAIVVVGVADVAFSVAQNIDENAIDFMSPQVSAALSGTSIVFGVLSLGAGLAVKAHHMTKIAKLKENLAVLEKASVTTLDEADHVMAGLRGVAENALNYGADGVATQAKQTQVLKRVWSAMQGERTSMNYDGTLGIPGGGRSAITDDIRSVVAETHLRHRIGGPVTREEFWQAKQIVDEAPIRTAKFNAMDRLEKNRSDAKRFFSQTVKRASDHRLAAWKQISTGCSVVSLPIYPLIVPIVAQRWNSPARDRSPNTSGDVMGEAF